MILLVGHLINWKWSCKVGLRWQLHNALRRVVWTPANKWRIYPKGVWHDPVPSGSHHNKTFRQTYEVRIFKCQVFYYFITNTIFCQIIRLLMNVHQWRNICICLICFTKSAFINNTVKIIVILCTFSYYQCWKLCFSGSSDTF